MAAQLTWQWLRFEALGVHNLYDTLALRCRVFILEQGAFQDPDGVDQHCWHLLGRDGAGVLHAYLRAVDPGVKYAEPSIGRVITSPELRGSGAGRVLVREGIERSQAAWPGQALRISAQARLRQFYADFGFEDVGEEYGEDDIPHQEMLLLPPKAQGQSPQTLNPQALSPQARPHQPQGRHAN